MSPTTTATGPPDFDWGAVFSGDTTSTGESPPEDTLLSEPNPIRPTSRRTALVANVAQTWHYDVANLDDHVCAWQYQHPTNLYVLSSALHHSFGVHQTLVFWCGGSSASADLTVEEENLPQSALASVFLEASVENWDGYGAKAVTPLGLERARRFLTQLPPSVQTPEIAAEPDGDLAFEWYRDPEYVLSVSVSPDGVLSYAGLFGPNKAHGTEVMSNELPTAIAFQLERLFS